MGLLRPQPLSICCEGTPCALIREGTVTAPEAGWYIDPAEATHQRWWNGETWTEHQRPVLQTAPPQSPEAASAAKPQEYVTMTANSREYMRMASQSGAASGGPMLPLYRGEKDREIRRSNSFAYTGCVLALVGFLFNPFAIPSILGIVFSAIGLAKSHDLESVQKVTGRGTAIAGIVIGLAGLAFFGWRLTQVFA